MTTSQLEARKPKGAVGAIARCFPGDEAVASDCAEEISLAEFDAVVTKDVVGGGGVEIETRQREIAQIPLTAEGHGSSGTNVDGDVSCFRTVEL